MKKNVRTDCGQFILPIKVINELPKDKTYKLLDIGAGDRYIESFLPKNIKYFSLDCQGEQDYIFDLDKGKLPIKDNIYDIILCLETLEHTLYPHRIMKEILRIAKPDALFLLSMPNEYNFYCRLNFLMSKKTDIQKPFLVIEDHLHIHLPRVEDILTFFSQYIKIEKTDYQWYSRTSFHNKEIRGRISAMLDRIVNKFSKVCPSLFTRTVVVKGYKKINGDK